jgi:hypothetical protein
MAITRRNVIIALLAAVFAVIFAWLRGQPPLPVLDAVGHSGESFTIGEQFVVIDYGYLDGGDKLAFAVIRSWPTDSSIESRSNDPRFDLNLAGLPLVRHSDGQLREVGTDGRVYVFFGDQLRTMRVQMNEHTDTDELSRQKDMEGIWGHLKQFQVKP